MISITMVVMDGNVMVAPAVTLSPLYSDQTQQYLVTHFINVSNITVLLFSKQPFLKFRVPMYLCRVSVRPLVKPSFYQES